MRKNLILLLFAGLVGIVCYYKTTLIRLYQGFQLQRVSQARAQLYELTNGATIQDITQEIIDDQSVPARLKAPLIAGERRIVIFKYPSDAEQVAGYLSYIPHGCHPTLIFLRGGNGFLGIMRPNNQFAFFSGYNVVGTLYRGNIYGGVDELGGADIRDVENLVRYFPDLAQFIGVKLSAPFSMLGISRGAMEMFTALSHSDYLKARVNYAIAISGNVDLTESARQRPEMRYLFNSKFKASREQDFKTWLNHRDPVHNAQLLPKSLKVLLVYGLKDNRVSLAEQQNFQRALEQAHVSVQLNVIPEGDHQMEDCFAELEAIILRFLASK